MISWKQLNIIDECKDMWQTWKREKITLSNTSSNSNATEAIESKKIYIYIGRKGVPSKAGIEKCDKKASKIEIWKENNEEEVTTSEYTWRCLVLKKVKGPMKNK